MRGAALAGQVAEAVGWLVGWLEGGCWGRKGKYITEKRCRYSKSRQPKNGVSRTERPVEAENKNGCGRRTGNLQ
jgi:hypothetical protein